MKAFMRDMAKVEALISWPKSLSGAADGGSLVGCDLSLEISPE